jgi:hypothetical protein
MVRYKEYAFEDTFRSLSAASVRLRLFGYFNGVRRRYASISRYGGRSTRYGVRLRGD